MFVRNLTALTAIALLGVGCNGCPRADHAPRLSEGTIRQLSDKAALDQGVKLANFNPPVIRFDAIECTWSASYDMSGPNPIIDSGFTVLVNDVTGSVQSHGQP
jgi:hypothetical protein